MERKLSGWLRHHRLFGVAVAALALSVGSAGASVPDSTDAGTPSDGSSSDERLAQQVPRWAHPPGSERSGNAYRTSSSFFINVPFWQDVSRDVVRPGASLEGRAGLNLGVLMPEVELGFTWVPIDLDEVEPGFGRDPLKRFFLGVGLRLQIPTPGQFMPYVSAAFDLNWWNFRETVVGCGWWYCTNYDTYRFTPGFSGRAGFTFRLNPAIGLDVGTTIGMSFPGDFFDRNEWWIGPHFGVTVFQ